MQKYDLVRVIKDTEFVKAGATGAYIGELPYQEGIKVVLFNQGVEEFEDYFFEEELEVIANVDDMKYSFDQFKKTMLQEHGDMLTSILLTMGAGDYNLDGTTWKEMKKLGRHFVFDWYHYDV